ncbi:Phosphoenolpyruvate carboxylase [compost metagenome]
MKTLTPELRHLVSQSVALLGRVIQRELGKNTYQKIENLRQDMAELRELSADQSFSRLQKVYKRLEAEPRVNRHAIAHSFTLMLELMNACENAYRSYRLSSNQAPFLVSGEHPKAIIYVLTAHPTEARSPLNIAIFHQIQNLLISFLNSSHSEGGRDLLKSEKNDLLHLLEIAWRTPIVRERSPKVKDEAEHIYSLLFRDDVLFSILDFSDKHVPVYIRSWVGGDKDGHPGVDEKVLLQSLTLSRQRILAVFLGQLNEIRKTLALFRAPSLLKTLGTLEKQARSLRLPQRQDGQRVLRLRILLAQFRQDYENQVGAVHPSLRRLRQLCHVFPGLVVPLELREASDVLMSKSKGKKKLPIEKMLSTIESLSRGGDPRWYARGFIISMTESMAHIQAAAEKQRAVFHGDLRLPIIPLFEEASSLADSDKIMKEMTQDPQIKKAATKFWDGLIEMMVGYSDSAKEAGVLASRLAIAEALPRLEKVCESAKLTPLFFHGSGGSIDRGGGSIEDQTAWWPKSALRRYKGTIQGEMVERTLATPAIAERQLSQIFESASEGLEKNQAFTKDPVLAIFAQNISAAYREQITSPAFLKMVEAATPYSYLNVLKIGSRPSKRTKQLTVSGLRAIPWVLCWTQTRVLFQTWWGVGSAWESLNTSQRSALKKSFQKDAVFTSYVKALGFTLAKIELEVWQLYLDQSSLSETEKKNVFLQFKTEYEKTLRCFRELTGHQELLWFRPWLAESIRLRSPMIHPLNILQILAKKEKDVHLLRVTVTGVASGMLTTG